MGGGGDKGPGDPDGRDTQMVETPISTSSGTAFRELF